MQRFRSKLKSYTPKGCVLLLFLLLMVSVGCDTQAATLKEKGKPKDIEASSKGEYHKLIVKKSSFVGISAFGNSKATKNKKIAVVCLNSKKKAISPVSYTNMKKTAYYTLKPGTYYIRVKSPVRSYRISAAFQHVKDRAGTSKKKAAPLRLRKEVYGILYHTDSIKRQHWYKFRLTTPKKVKLTIKKAGGRIGFKISGPTEAAAQIAEFQKFRAVTLPAGDYYILLSKPNKKAAKDGVIYSLNIK